MSFSTPLHDSTALYEKTFVVPLSDTDASGRTHFSAVFRWVEAAEHEFLGTVEGVDATAFPRVRVDAEYARPTRFGDRLTVRIGWARPGRTSIRYAWSVLRAADGPECARGELVAVHVDAADRSAELPPALLRRVQG